MTQTIQHLIDGKRTGGGTRTQAVYNPATGAVSGQVLLADLSETELDRVLTPLVRELPLKQAVALAVEISGAARNAVYARALVLKQSGEEE